MFGVKIFTLYPDLYPGPLNTGIYKKAQENKIWDLKVINIRNYATDKHNSVDDRPFGGGPGMIMSPQPLKNAISKARDWIDDSLKVVYLSPQGALVTQSKIKSMTDENNFIFIAEKRVDI